MNNFRHFFFHLIFSFSKKKEEQIKNINNTKKNTMTTINVIPLKVHCNVCNKTIRTRACHRVDSKGNFMGDVPRICVTECMDEKGIVRKLQSNAKKMRLRIVSGRYMINDQHVVSLENISEHTFLPYPTLPWENDTSKSRLTKSRLIVKHDDTR
jgi:hypothetical protein